MWNNTRLLNMIATGMFLLAGVIVVNIGVVLAINSPRFPLARATVHGTLGHVTREQVHEALLGRTIGNFFSADLEQVKRLIEEIPWVRRAEVRRQWPDRLEIAIEEHQLLGRWGEKQLVNVFGEVFAGQAQGDLPRLSGPVGTERDVTQRYYRFQQMAKALDTEPVEMVLTPRYAWHVKFANGLSVDLGREQSRSPIEARFQRFVAAHPNAADTLGRPIVHADLRYSNGFAVRVPGLIDVVRPVAKKKS
jgi:cell division protein FtsQ